MDNEELEPVREFVRDFAREELRLSPMGSTHLENYAVRRLFEGIPDGAMALVDMSTLANDWILTN